MVKVRYSQLDKEMNEQHNKKKPKKYKVEMSEETDDEESEDEGPEQIIITKKYIRLEDFGASIYIYGIESIENDFKFVEKPSAHWEYGIVINKGMTQSMRFPKVDIEFWFLDEEVRDKRMNNIIKVLNENGFTFLKA